MAQVGRPINKLHQDDVRKKIQVSQLLNVLQNHALGTTENLSPTRMKAIEILLRKSMPDMASITISGDSDQPIQHIVTWAK
jgi:hypothetical protein